MLVVVNVNDVSFCSPLTLADELVPVLADGNDEPDGIRLVFDTIDVPVLAPPFAVPF